MPTASGHRDAWAGFTFESMAMLPPAFRLSTTNQPWTPARMWARSLMLSGWSNGEKAGSAA
jgi:hypothetical protein